MIEPFLGHEDQEAWKQEMGKETISAGVTSYGYDARLAPDVQMLEHPLKPDDGSGASYFGHRVIDPKSFDPDLLRPIKPNPVTRAVTLPPHSFVLAHTIETFKIPRNVLVVCVGKSTYARCGLIVNVTPLEPEWEGQVTLEISNTTPVPANVYVGEGVCQMIFHTSADFKHEQVAEGWHNRHVFNTGGCSRSYADKGGRYQHQEGIVTPTAERTVQATD